MQTLIRKTLDMTRDLILCLVYCSIACDNTKLDQAQFIPQRETINACPNHSKKDAEKTLLKLKRKCCFVDIKKAQDRVPRKMMEQTTIKKVCRNYW